MNIKNKICIASMTISLSIGAVAQGSNVGKITGLVNAGLYQQALAGLDEIQDAEGQIELQKLRALSNLELRQYATAEVIYLRIHSVDNGVDVSNNLGLAYLRQLKFVDAIQIFQNTIRRYPLDGAAYANLGDAYLFLAQSTYKKGADIVVDSDQLQTKYSAAFESLKKKSTTEFQATFTKTEPKFKSGARQILDSHNEAQTKRINRMLSLWAKAKSNNSLDAYYAYYTSREYAMGSTQKSDYGKVRAMEPTVQFISNDQANLVFDEWSGPYSKRTRLFKQLNLALVDSEWKITGERVLHAY